MAKPYHHGDLRQAALDVALATVEQSGAANLSIRKVAEEVGVTHRALYRHFDSKARLLQEVLCEGFRLFNRQLLSANETPEAFASAYVDFAMEHPHLYALMMREPPGERSPEVMAAQAPVIAWMQRSFPSDDAAIQAWMVLHGGLSLAEAGVLQRRDKVRLRAFLLKIVANS